MKNRAKKVRDIDAQIGRRIREARAAQTMSQTALADRIDITFQQVQKYETGANRVSAGRLFDIAHALGMPILYFYEGAEPLLNLRNGDGPPPAEGKPRPSMPPTRKQKKMPRRSGAKT